MVWYGLLWYVLVLFVVVGVVWVVGVGGMVWVIRVVEDVVVMIPVFFSILMAMLK